MLEITRQPNQTVLLGRALLLTVLDVGHRICHLGMQHGINAPQTKLTLTQDCPETLIVDGIPVKIVLLENKGQSRLGFDAPRSLRIQRWELIGQRKPY